MSKSESKNPFKESAERFTRLRNERPTAEQVRSIFEKERPGKPLKVIQDEEANIRPGDKVYKNYEWIVTSPDISSGRFIIKNTRFTVSFLLGCLAENMTADEIEEVYGSYPKECLPEVLRLASEITDKILDDFYGKGTSWATESW